ncbi:hypothetical protein VZT92_022703 [Zoarces viviparus]|uniref:Secreted protein n=1 Tax=Zoarces viviparus TaxID=48416 RepID=A0AAW1EBR7_ZOAVI
MTRSLYYGLLPLVGLLQAVLPRFLLIASDTRRMSGLVVVVAMCSRNFHQVQLDMLRLACQRSVHVTFRFMASPHLVQAPCFLQLIALLDLSFFHRCPHFLLDQSVPPWPCHTGES